LKIVILNYGTGNILSAKLAFEKVVGSEVKVARDISDANVDLLVLPGVGNFQIAASFISRLKPKIFELFDRGSTILGICLGMQLFGLKSEEGKGEGLGLLHGRSIRLPNWVRVPHMGWNTVEFVKYDPVLDSINNKTYFYFAHSYYLKLRSRKPLLAETEYGIRFPSIVRLGPLIGTQFHPEKSGRTGLQLLRNIIKVTRK
jgi:glutamine amidotransferase